jgi:hypothetical protein
MTLQSREKMRQELIDIRRRQVLEYLSTGYTSHREIALEILPAILMFSRFLLIRKKMIKMMKIVLNSKCHLYYPHQKIWFLRNTH